jgi:hypothetical protein
MKRKSQMNSSTSKRVETTEVTSSYNEYNMSEACFNIGGQIQRGSLEFPPREAGDNILGDPSDKEEDKSLNDLKNLLIPMMKSMFGAINQHAVIINNMKVKQKTFVEERELGECLGTVQNAMSLYNDEFVEVLEIPDNVKYSENTGRKLTDNTNKLANKVLQLGHACNYLYLRNSTDSENYNKFVNTVTTELSNRVNLDRYESEYKTMMDNYNNAFKKHFEEVNTKLSDLDSRANERLIEQGAQIGKLEKNTIWKITECENLLKNRASKQFVGDSVDQLEDKLSRVIEKNNETSTRTVGDMKTTVASLDEKLTEDQRTLKLELRKQMQEINEH